MVLPQDPSTDRQDPRDPQSLVGMSDSALKRQTVKQLQALLTGQGLDTTGASATPFSVRRGTRVPGYGLLCTNIYLHIRVLVLEYRSAVALKLQPGEHGSLLALSSLRRAASTRYHFQQPPSRRAASTIDFTYLIPQEFTLLAPPIGTLWGGSGATVGRQCGCVRPCGENSCVPQARKASSYSACRKRVARSWG